MEQDTLAVSVVVVGEDKQNKTTTVDSNSSNVNVNTDNDNNVDVNVNVTSEHVDIGTPEFVKLNATSNITYKPVVGVSSKDFKIQETIFKVFRPDHRGRNFEVKASPYNLMMKYFTKDFINQLVTSSNKYRQNQMVQEPDLY